MAGGDGGHRQRRMRQGVHGVLPTHLVRQGPPRLGCGQLEGRHGDDRPEILRRLQAFPGDPLVVPVDDGEAAHQTGRDVVRVPLVAEPLHQQPLPIQRCPAERMPRRATGDEGGGAATEPAAQGNLVADHNP